MKYSAALLGLVLPIVAANAGNWSSPSSFTDEGVITSTIYISVWATETSAVPTTIPTVVDRVVSSDGQFSTLSETSLIETTLTELVTVLIDTSSSTTSSPAQTVDVYNKLAVANRVGGDSTSSPVSYSNTTTSSQSIPGNWTYTGISISSSDSPSTTQLESQIDLGNKAASTGNQDPTTTAGSVSSPSSGSSSNIANSVSSSSGSTANGNSAPVSSLTLSASAEPTTLVTVNDDVTTTIQMTRTVFYDSNGDAYSTQGQTKSGSSSVAATLTSSSAAAPSVTFSGNSSTSLNSSHITNSTSSNSSTSGDLKKRDVQNVLIDSYRTFIETKPIEGEKKQQDMRDGSTLSYNYIPFDFKTGACKTRRQIAKDFESIKAHGHEAVRIYSIDECGDLLENVQHAARTKDLKLILGIDFVQSQSLESMKLAVDTQVAKISSLNSKDWDLIDRIVLGRDLLSSGALKNVQEIGQLLQYATRILSRQHFYKAVSVGDTYSLFQQPRIRDEICKHSLSIDLSIFDNSIKQDKEGEPATSSVKDALADIDSTTTGSGFCAGHRIHLGIEGSGYCQPKDGFFAWFKL